MQTLNPESLKSSQALVNEYKGNLFEFGMANALSRILGLEEQFLTSLSGLFKAKLVFYERELRKIEPKLIHKISVWAFNAADEITHCIKFEVKNIFLVGKITGGSHNDVWKEADILLKGKNDNEIFPLSVKLTKKDAFVNTKSGGIKSFYTQYFSQFENSINLQNELNGLIEYQFSQMCIQMHKISDLSPSEQFGNDWDRAGLPSLPGDLSLELKSVLLDFYKSIRDHLFKSLNSFYDQNQKEFAKSLCPLLGQGRGDLFQLTCYYKQLDGELEFSHVSILNSENILNALENIQFYQSESSFTSFEIKLNPYRLQIRIKPMNKFTTPSYKVNCSTKTCAIY